MRCHFPTLTHQTLLIYPSSSLPTSPRLPSLVGQDPGQEVRLSVDVSQTRGDGGWWVGRSEAGERNPCLTVSTWRSIDFSRLPDKVLMSLIEK